MDNERHTCTIAMDPDTTHYDLKAYKKNAKGGVSISPLYNCGVPAFDVGHGSRLWPLGTPIRSPPELSSSTV